MVIMAPAQRREIYRGSAEHPVDHRKLYALAKEVTGKHPRLAIRICNGSGVALATFLDGEEVEDRTIGFQPLIPQGGATVGFGDVNPVLFEVGAWDRNLSRFISASKSEARLPLSMLRMYLD